MWQDKLSWCSVMQLQESYLYLLNYANSEFGMKIYCKLKVEIVFFFTYL